MPFVKAIILSELNDDVCIFKYIAKDLKFKNEANENFLNGLRSGMNELYTDFKAQFNKLGECNNFQVSVMYDEYFLKKVQIGKNLLMITICDTDTLDMGALDLLFTDFQKNFTQIDDLIEKIDEM
eukprot:CAMPEP_0176372746 /NCGR_PEP_ID=MMETSP0126-20121128/25592_1 /TAXON_ID=141414 ORGANISM="Strombidinopsis acuminatum, Strain SPMC142" /NCGR_SAMPLE_ID=MMETSP0126 /ASSEMBLY_ACC=CAM_ASM_000229 /LENGTH=124 /DNA_ID=CAMNT_0017732683 /DNA_START=62 /DNA_END=436 /DNA_ORIENTATION=-